MYEFVFHFYFSTNFDVYPNRCLVLFVFHGWCVFLVFLCLFVFFVRGHDFACIVFLFVFMCLFACNRSTSPPGGNQVDGLPPALRPKYVSLIKQKVGEDRQRPINPEQLVRANFLLPVFSSV